MSRGFRSQRDRSLFVLMSQYLWLLEGISNYCEKTLHAEHITKDVLMLPFGEIMAYTRSMYGVWNASHVLFIINLV